jgi:hypothetical protein
MRRIVFVTAMAFGLVGLTTAQVRAQDEEPAGDPMGDPAGDPTAEPAEGGEGGMEAGGEAEAGGGMEGEGGGDMEAAPAKPLRIGVGAIVALPIAGDAGPDVPWTDLVGIGIGLAGQVLYSLSPQLAIAGTLGLVYHLPKDVGGVDISVMEIPILVGARYFVTPQIAVGGDTGINMIRTSIDAEGAETESETRIPLRLGADYMISGNLAAGAGLWISNLLLRDSDVEEGMLMQIEAHVGYFF